jgi:tripartite-type tricarboxylate transporter receptor subunit TctC
MKRNPFLFIVIAAAFGFEGAATAQSYPNRPVTLIVPFSVATASDVLARTVGKQMGERLGTSVVVDNRPGASGSIGNSMVGKAAPDGYTLLVTATSFIISKSLNPSLPYDPARNYTPVALLATDVMGLMVSSEMPTKSVAELVALAKSRPGVLFYASPGNGTPQHMSMELFKMETDTDIVHVPYKEQSGALTDLVAGRANMMITPIFGAMKLIQAGKIRLIAMLTSERTPSVASVPTFKEAGFPTLEVAVWYGLLGPAGLPADVLGRLNREINASLEHPEVRDVFEKRGLTPGGGSPERFAEWMRAEMQRWPRVVAKAGIKPD